MRRALIVPAVVALLTGCGGGSTPPPSPPPPVAAASPSPATPSTPATLTRTDAAARYQQLVAPFNQDGTALNTQIAALNHKPLTDPVPSSARTAAATMQQATRTFMAGILATPWPADITPTAQQVVDELSTEVSTYGDLAKAKTVQDVQDTMSAAKSDNSASQKMRVQLGLPAAG